MKKILVLILMMFLCSNAYAYKFVVPVDEKGSVLGTSTNPITVVGSGGVSLCKSDGTNCPANIGVGTVNPGVTNFHSKYVNQNTIDDSSLIFDNGTNVGIGTITTSQLLTVKGSSYFNGNLGIGVSSPTAGLHINMSTPATVGSGSGTAGTNFYTIATGTGGSTTESTTASGGAGSGVSLTGGTGGTASSAATASTGGAGGASTFLGGTGGAAAVAGTGSNTGGAGGADTRTGGTGGAATGSTSGTNTGGAGGALTYTGGVGGAANTGSGNLVGGTGGAVTISGGLGGVGTTSGGNGGAVIIRGGLSANQAGAASGNVTVQTQAGTSTGSGGASGTLTISTGAAGGDNTVNRAAGPINITAGASKGSSTGAAITATAGAGGVGTGTTGATGGNISLNAGAGGLGSATGGTGGDISIKAGVGGASGTPGSGGQIRMYTSPDNTSALERLTINKDGNVGIGDTTPTDKLSLNAGSRVVSNGDTDSISQWDGSFSSAADNPTGNLRSFYMNPKWTGSSLIGTLSGSYIILDNDSTAGTIPHALATVSRFYNNSTGNATIGAGFYGTVQQDGAGTIDDAAAFWANQVTKNAGTITNAHSFHGEAHSGATTNNYGFSHDSLSGTSATNNKIDLLLGTAPAGPITASIYQAETTNKNYFGGSVGIGTTAPPSIFSVNAGASVGQVTIDGGTGGCIMLRDTDDAGWTECDALDGTLSCSTDADGICD